MKLVFQFPSGFQNTECIITRIPYIKETCGGLDSGPLFMKINPGFVISWVRKIEEQIAKVSEDFLPFQE